MSKAILQPNAEDEVLSQSQPPAHASQTTAPAAVMDSPLHSFSTDIRTELDEFRDNWQRELKSHSENGSPSRTVEQKQQSANALVSTENGMRNATEIDQHKLAENLFRSAVELEQRGKVYDALPLYRKAVQIVPDIEFKFYELQKVKSAATVGEGKKMFETTQPIETPKENLETEELVEDLYEKFQLDLARDGGHLLLSSRDASVITTETHISELPPEILLYILRWVVSTQLDIHSLEQCAGVCKGLYLCARDEELWRSVCTKVWGADLGTLGEPIQHTQADDLIESVDTTPMVYTSWRQMFIMRERVIFSGCYISKTTYLRMGENSFQDQYYRPVQLVEYYRYVRFLGDGRVLMMTSADEPAQGVNKLKNINQLRPEVLCGHYRLYGDTITILLKKQQQQLHSNNSHQYARHRRSSMATFKEEPNCTKYCIEFRITNTTKRKYARLLWAQYSVVQTRNKVETSSQFDLTPSKYPPLWFSPVRSYHLDTDAPLS
ncbi:F-box only protein 9 [Rhagoletis pomonella]|uniref:F-box only protein 9 n=1 Tax=Rhagoletis pomonella TaxID=28610 RepID=UPI001783A22E|nr:F-box only protein 9 [Rhagoletis pomonella]